jgi:DNA-directed RNA polymerase specialized sigma24 family protein
MPEVPPFALFLEEQRQPVYRFLVATVGAQAADDCFQETFLSALKAFGRLQNGANLRAWVLAIASRKAIDHLRGQRRRPVPMAKVPERAAPAVAPLDPGLRRGIAALPPLQRAAVVQRYVLDLSYAEVAQALGCSEEAARANAYEGRKKLRAHLTGRTR